MNPYHTGLSGEFARLQGERAELHLKDGGGHRSGQDWDGLVMAKIAFELGIGRISTRLSRKMLL